ncbi:DNA mismatch repair protein MutS [Pedobacter sp. MC2016-15]|uniref:MutS-related protein n=1 Tax=Pedobacter sp. MC2016-15 TaxID=2994473 RepID=UPI0022471F56|nr:DNA mismatch repair protein MutS [Pedobacter sp. MC2016-15]MCX2479009.1 DNA mismatch repair protein MutS [Pedobacter sp. MC2016-15]
MVKSKDSILKDYQNNVEIQASAVSALKKTLNQISYSRLGMFLIEILLVAIIISYGYHWSMGILAVIPLIGFMALLKRQVKVQDQLNYTEKLLFVYQNEVDLIITGKQKYDDGSIFADESHPYSSDLDIYGPSSLYALLNRSNTVEGMQLLAASLGSPVHTNDLPERQEAIRELRENIMKTFHFRAGLQNHQPQQLELIKYRMSHDMAEDVKFTESAALKAYTAAVPFISLAFLIVGAIFGGVAWSFLSLYILFNWCFTAYYAKKLLALSGAFSGGAILLGAVSGSVKWTEEVQWKSSYIQKFFTGDSGNQQLSKQIKTLSGIVNAFDASNSMILGPILNGLLLWSLRQSVSMGKWYAAWGIRLISALQTISRFEELISFATLAHNEPEWQNPIFSDEFHFEARALGHPLIREEKRVVNHYEFGKLPTVDIVTGSNMAGKSTFLRTVGINMVLAFTGAPVCAASMKTSVFEILTYMRIKDSLNDQTSTFKAELNRLKMILEGVKKLQHPLVLIDEMLRGTNSKDKYLGSKVFIQQMMKEHTPTLFATHDLQLSEMTDSHPDELRNYHFDIQLSHGEMKFDYQLKYGACKTFNAALLLKEIGLSFNPEELN